MEHITASLLVLFVIGFMIPNALGITNPTKETTRTERSRDTTL